LWRFKATALKVCPLTPILSADEVNTCIHFSGLAQAVFNTTIAIAALERDAAGPLTSHEIHRMLVVELRK
jgi:hypothetical protein